MKYIIAIVQPNKLDPLQDALSELGVSGITASEVKGYGRQKGKTELYRGAEYTINFIPKIKIEVATDDAIFDQTVETILSIGHSGKIGDGKIFVFDLNDAYRIRTRDTGVSAL